MCLYTDLEYAIIKPSTLSDRVFLALTIQEYSKKAFIDHIQYYLAKHIVRL